MADFQKALDVVFKHEGGFSDDPDDKGGATKYGITLATLRRALGAGADFNHDGKVDGLDVALLSRDQAADIYLRFYWNRPGIWRIRDQYIATKTFDMAVHMGPLAAIRLLQRAVGRDNPSAGIVEDGIFGPITETWTNTANQKDLLSCLCSVQAEFYRAIVEDDSTQRKFLRNWLRRALWPF